MKVEEGGSCLPIATPGAACGALFKVLDIQLPKAPPHRATCVDECKKPPERRKPRLKAADCCQRVLAPHLSQFLPVAALRSSLVACHLSLLLKQRPAAPSTTSHIAIVPMSAPPAYHPFVSSGREKGAPKRLRDPSWHRQASAVSKDSLRHKLWVYNRIINRYASQSC
jgi:hypothetical protein